MRHVQPNLFWLLTAQTGTQYIPKLH